MLDKRQTAPAEIARGLSEATPDTREEYSARPITEGREAGKWAVFRGDERVTKGGGENSAKSWARFMNRQARRP